MCSGSEAGSYLRLTDSCITQLKAQGPSRTCNESEEEEDEATWEGCRDLLATPCHLAHRFGASGPVSAPGHEAGRKVASFADLVYLSPNNEHFECIYLDLVTRTNVDGFFPLTKNVNLKAVGLM